MTDYLQTAIDAARQAGKLQRDHFGQPLDVHALEAHDIKLDLGVEMPKLQAGQLYFLSPTFVN